MAGHHSFWNQNFKAMGVCIYFLIVRNINSVEVFEEVAVLVYFSATEMKQRSLMMFLRLKDFYLRLNSISTATYLNLWATITEF